MLISYCFLQYLVALGLPRWVPEGNPKAVPFSVPFFDGFGVHVGRQKAPKKKSGGIKKRVQKWNRNFKDFGGILGSKTDPKT